MLCEASDLLKKIAQVKHREFRGDRIKVTFRDVYSLQLNDFVLKLNQVSKKYPVLDFVVAIHMEGRRPSKEEVENAVKLKNHRNIDFVMIAMESCACCDPDPIHEEVWIKGNWSTKRKAGVKGIETFLFQRKHLLPVELYKRIFSYLI